MTENQSNRRPCLYSIGHSNHDAQVFLDLLARHGIQAVADVRSQPYSKYADQFNSEPLKHLLSAAGVSYVFLGKELGGRPDGDTFYDGEGHVRYDRVAESPLFLQGIERLEQGAEQYRVAMMCSEENPCDCHRFLLVARVLENRGLAVQHIRGDGRLQTNDEIRRERLGDDRQPFLFEELEEPPWRSIRSVLPNQRPATSSND